MVEPDLRTGALDLQRTANHFGLCRCGIVARPSCRSPPRRGTIRDLSPSRQRIGVLGGLPDSRSLDRNLEEAVTLTGAKVARDATHVELLDIGIRKQRILSLGARTGGDVEIDLSGYLILPG